MPCESSIALRTHLGLVLMSCSFDKLGRLEASFLKTCCSFSCCLHLNSPSSHMAWVLAIGKIKTLKTSATSVTAINGSTCSLIEQTSITANWRVVEWMKTYLFIPWLSAINVIVLENILGYPLVHWFRSRPIDIIDLHIVSYKLGLCLINWLLSQNLWILNRRTEWVTRCPLGGVKISPHLETLGVVRLRRRWWGRWGEKVGLWFIEYHF